MTPHAKKAHSQKSGNAEVKPDNPG